MTFGDAHFAEAWLPGESETITYRPDGVALSDRSIEAVVERDPPEPVRETPGLLRPGIIVHVRNDATLGISAAELDTGQDVLLLAKRVGGTAVAMHIATILTQDAGLLSLEVR